MTGSRGKDVPFAIQQPSWESSLVLGAYRGDTNLSFCIFNWKKERKKGQFLEEEAPDFEKRFKFYILGPMFVTQIASLESRKKDRRRKLRIINTLFYVICEFIRKKNIEII